MRESKTLVKAPRSAIIAGNNGNKRPPLIIQISVASGAIDRQITVILSNAQVARSSALLVQQSDLAAFQLLKSRKMNYSLLRLFQWLSTDCVVESQTEA